MKQHSITALMLSAACMFCGVTADFSAAAETGSTEVQTVRIFPEENGSWQFYEYGCAGDPSAMQFSSGGTADGTQFSSEDGPVLTASWENVRGAVVSAGFSVIEDNMAHPEKTPFSLRGHFEELSYSGQCRLGWESVFGVHGWLSDPRAEFFVVEGYYSLEGLIPDKTKHYCGEITMNDGEVYKIYRTQKTGRTPYAERETYSQYWSVRDEEHAKHVGTGSTFSLKTPLTNHFAAWAMLGMELGTLEQTDVRLLCDPDTGYEESGSVTLKTLRTTNYTVSTFQLRDSVGAAVTSLRPGDLNTDGRITREDLKQYDFLLKNVSNAFLLHMTSMEQHAADLNGDQKIDARDKTLLKRYLLNASAAAEEIPDVLPGTNRKLIFSDEFDGDKVDHSKWSYDLGNWKLDRDGNYVTNGWGNNEQQFYTDKNASVKDGVLTIAARHETYTDAKQGSYEYTSAKLTTAQKFSSTGGRIEVRARCDAGKSLWPAIWMLPEQELYGGWAASGEIDIMEGWGSKPETICGTIHFGDVWPDNRYLTADYQFPEGTSAADWHVYAVEWEKGCIKWYADGQLYSTQTEWSSSGYAYPAPFDQDFYLILNLAVGGTFDGIDGIYGEPATFADGEKQFQIDYVRVYEPEEPFKSVRDLSPRLELYTEGAEAKLTNSENGTEITVSSVGELEYAVMALLRSQKVSAAENYTLSFKAESSVPRDMLVTVEDSTYKRYFEQKIPLSEVPEDFGTMLVFPADMDVDLKFQLGNLGDAAAAGPHTVRLYDIQLEPAAVTQN